MIHRLLPAAAVAALVLVFVPPASAKGPIQVCGASACAELGAEAEPPVRVSSGAPGSMALPSPTPAPYFTIRFSAVAGSPLAYWIPSASILRVPTGPQGWLATLPAEEALLRAKTAGLQPFAAPTRAPVLVGYRPVRRPIGYLRLFTIGAPVAAAPSAGGWLTISIQGGRTPSPWTDGTTSFLISRRGGFLSRDGRVLRISTTLARRIRSRLPLTG